MATLNRGHPLSCGHNVLAKRVALVKDYTTVLFCLLQYWVRVPLKAPEDDLEDVIEDAENTSTENFEERPWKHDTWKWYTVCF